MEREYDYIVVGGGGIGSAASYWLARNAGQRVLGLEQFPLGHDHGGSQDHSRIIRLSYHDERYVPLAQASYRVWAEVQEQARQRLVVQTGGLDLAPDDPAGRRSLEAYASAIKRHDIAYEELSASDAMKRFPQLHLRRDDLVIYQAQTGLVDARRANAVHIALARHHGATILPNTQVTEIEPNNARIAVETTAGRFAARRGVVIAAGAWTNRVLRSLGVTLPLSVSQEQVTYWATPNVAEFSPERFPVWVWHDAHLFYGLPIYGEVATKAAEDGLLNFVELDERTYEPDLAAVERLEAFLRERIPGFLGPLLYTKTCLYTLPPDRHFILDRLPGEPRVAVAVGAGHAYKFASLIGQILRDLVVDGQSSYSLDGFELGRPALADPAFRGSLRL